MAKTKAYVTIIRTGEEAELDDGPTMVTPEMLRDMAEKNGWRVEEIPGEPGALRALVEIEVSVPTPGKVIEAVGGTDA